MTYKYFMLTISGEATRKINIINLNINMHLCEKCDNGVAYMKVSPWGAHGDGRPM